MGDSAWRVRLQRYYGQLHGLILAPTLNEQRSDELERTVGPAVAIADRISGTRKEVYDEPIDGASGSLPLTPEADPLDDTVTLEAGFVPDPHESEFFGGGPVDARVNQNDCVGYAKESPNVRLEWTGETEELRIFFTADNELEDATLLVKRQGSDAWFCNDDSGSRNPLVILKEPPEGRYDIWVGSYGGARSIPGRLSITELGYGPASWLDALAAFGELVEP